MKTEATQKCECDFCTKWHPMHRRILAKLDAESAREFIELTNHLMMWAEDGDYWRCRAEGNWPGCEHMQYFTVELCAELARMWCPELLPKS